MSLRPDCSAICFLPENVFKVARLHSAKRGGGDERDRTADPLLAKQVLSQLSYAPSNGGPGRI